MMGWGWTWGASGRDGDGCEEGGLWVWRCVWGILGLDFVRVGGLRILVSVIASIEKKQSLCRPSVWS